MNNPINYIASMGDSFTNGFFQNNIENNERVDVFSLSQSGDYKAKAEFTLFPKNSRFTNNKESIKMFDDILASVNNPNGTSVYGFDIETFGNAINPLTDLEKETAMISEFSLSKMNIKRNSSGMFDTGDVDEVINYTFGINEKQRENLLKIINKVEGNFDLTSTEFASFQNLLRYGGANINSSKGSEFFSFKDGIYTINKHAQITNEFNTTQARTGLNNLTFIGKNQYIGTKNGNTLLNNVKSAIGNIKTNGSPLISFNGTAFDVPFVNEVFNTFGVNNILDGVNHFDAFQVMNTSSQFSILDNAIRIAAENGVEIPREHLGTLISQGLLRGIDFKDIAHQANVDVRSMLEMIFKGNNSLFNTIQNDISNVSSIDVQTFNKNQVLYSNNALPIGSKGSRYNTIEYGVLDQYIEDGNPLHYYSFSTNRGQYYGIDDFGFIPREALGKEALGYLSDNSNGLYYMKLNNMADGVDKQAMIFRENLSDYERILQSNFSVFNYFPDANMPMNDVDTVSQYDINKATMYYELDKTRRESERIKNPKDYKGIDRVRKDNALYSYINDRYKQAISANYSDIGEIADLSQETIEDLIKGNTIKLSSIDPNAKDLSLSNIKKDLKELNLSKSDIKSFVSRYNRIKDEFSLNNSILSYIDSNLNSEVLGINTSNARGKNILRAVQTDAYNYILNDLSEKYIDYNIDGRDVMNLPDNIKRTILEDKFYGYSNMPKDSANINAVDILSMKKETLLQNNNASSLSEISSNKLYTRIDATNIENTAKKIRNLAASTITNNKLTEKEIIESKREYLLDLAYDFERRGVFEKGYNQKIKATDDVYNASLQIARDLSDVLDLAKSQLSKNELLELNTIASNKAIESKTTSDIGRRYANLTKQRVKTINTNGHTLDGKDVYNYIAGMFDETSDIGIDEYLKGITSEYSNRVPRSFMARSVDSFDDNKQIQSWLRGLGYTDKNVETLKSALFGNNGIANINDDIAFHFYTKEINGANVPFVSLTDRKTNAMSYLMKGEQIPNAANIMLPYVFNANMNGVSDVVDTSTSNRFVQIGGVTKSIVNRQNTYLKNGAIMMNEQDTIDQILNMFRLKKEEIKNGIANKDYRRVERSLNRYSQRVQLDEVGVSQKIATYGPGGTLNHIFVPRRSDLDLASKNISDGMAKYLPYLYDYELKNPKSNEAINSFVTNMTNSFKDNYKENYVSDMMSNLKKDIQSNKNFNFGDLPPDMQEFMRRYTMKDYSFLNAVSEYSNIIGDSKGYDIVTRMMNNNAHALTKDSHGVRYIIDEGTSTYGTTMAHLSGIARSVNIQSRNNIPFMYDEFNLGFVTKKVDDALGDYDVVDGLNRYGVKFGSTISSNSDAGYVSLMKGSGYNIVNGLTANILQANPESFLTDFNNIKSNKPIMMDKFNEVNAMLDGKYTLEQFEEVFDLLTTNFATYEQGGLLNPRMKFLYDKPQIFTETVGEEYFNDIIGKLNNGEVIPINKGDSLGYLDDTSKAKIFNGQNGRVIGIDEVQGTERKKFKVKYIHDNENLQGKVKLYTSYGEKGIFNIPDAGKDLNPLLYKLYDNIFGENTFGVASYDLFKHNSFGALASSYLNVMFDEYSKNEDSLSEFVATLNRYLPQYDFRVGTHTNTGIKQLLYNESPTVIGDKTMYNAITSMVNDINSSDNEIDKIVSARIKDMEKRGYIRTEIQTASLEEGFGQSVKYEKRLEQILGSHADTSLYTIFGDEAVKISEEINKTFRSELLGSNSYNSGYDMLQNIKSTVDNLTGTASGIVKEVDINDIDIPYSMASYDEILDSIIFDFNQTNEFGAKVNSFKIPLPGGVEIENPFMRGQTVDSIIIPSLKPYQADEYMLSNFQKKIASLAVDLKEMQRAYDNNEHKTFLNTREALESKYKSAMASIYEEFVDKDGLINKNLKSMQLDRGGFSIVSKIIEPIIDEKTGGFLDPSAKNFWKTTKDGVMFYDNIEMSEGAFNSMGVYFDEIGMQLHDNMKEYDDVIKKLDIEKFNNIDTMKRNIALAQETLDNTKRINAKTARELELTIALNKNAIGATYKAIGEEYLSREGIFSVSGRYPFVKQDSALVTKVFYNPSLKGNSFIASPLLSLKTKLDTDGDMMAFIMNGIYNKETGRLRIFGSNSYLNQVYEKIYQAQASGVGYQGNKFLGNNAIIKALSNDRIEEIRGDKFLTGGKGSYMDLYESFVRSGVSNEALTILDFDNFFNNELDVDLALKTISSKTSIGYISNDNYILKELAGYMYSNDKDLNKLNLIQYFTDKMEQGIFNSKHISSDEYKLLMGKPYRNALKNLRSKVYEENEQGLVDLVNVLNNIGIYDNITLANVENNTATNIGEETVLAIKDLLSDKRTRDIREDPLFWRNAYKDDSSINLIKNILYKGNTLGVNGALGRDYELFENLDDYKALDIGGSKIGQGSFIKMSDDSIYSVSELNKLHTNDAIVDMLQLKNQYGEEYHLIGNTFNEISNMLTSNGATIVDGFSMSSELGMVDRMFASQDNFVREMMYSKSLNHLGKRKSLNDSKALNKNMTRTARQMNLSTEAMLQMKEYLLSTGDSSTIRKYKNFYNEVFSLTEDVFEETYDVINFLNETNVYTSNEVMRYARGYYDDMVLNLSNEMNDSIRQKALQDKKLQLYKEVVPEHIYTSFEDYVDDTNRKANARNARYTNTVSNKVQDFNEFYNTDIPNKYKVNNFDELINLGKFNIDVNGKTSMLNELGISEIVSYVTANNNSGAILTESQERAKYYLLENIRLGKQYGETLAREGDRISQAISETMADATREGASKLARETTEKASSKFLKESLEYIGKHKFVTAAMIAGAIGTVSAVTNISQSQPLQVENKPNGTSPSSDGTYQDNKSKQRVAPKTDSRVYLSRNNSNGYEVNASNVGRSKNQGMVEKLKGFVGPGTNININERNDVSTVSDTWLKEKISNLL